MSRSRFDHAASLALGAVLPTVGAWGCGTDCLPQENSILVSLGEGEDIAVIRVSNDQSDVERSVGGFFELYDRNEKSPIEFDVVGAVTNVSMREACDLTVQVFRDEPDIDGVYFNDPLLLPIFRTVEVMHIPSMSDGRAYTQGFFVDGIGFKENDAFPEFTTWIVFVGCADAAIEVEVSAIATWCPHTRESDEYVVELTQELPTPEAP